MLLLLVSDNPGTVRIEAVQIAGRKKSHRPTSSLTDREVVAAYTRFWCHMYKVADCRQFGSVPPQIPHLEYGERCRCEKRASRDQSVAANPQKYVPGFTSVGRHFLQQLIRRILLNEHGKEGAIHFGKHTVPLATKREQ
jgi:hypothetical protein